MSSCTAVLTPKLTQGQNDKIIRNARRGHRNQKISLFYIEFSCDVVLALHWKDIFAEINTDACS